MNKFAQVSTDDHQMSLAGGEARGIPRSDIQVEGWGGSCTVVNASWG